jgi:hypothetical protein
MLQQDPKNVINNIVSYQNWLTTKIIDYFNIKHEQLQKTIIAYS